MFVHLLSTAALAGGLLAAPARRAPCRRSPRSSTRSASSNLSTIDLSGLGAGRAEEHRRLHRLLHHDAEGHDRGQGPDDGPRQHGHRQRHAGTRHAADGRRFLEGLHLARPADGQGPDRQPGAACRAAPARSSSRRCWPASSRAARRTPRRRARCGPTRCPTPPPPTAGSTSLKMMTTFTAAGEGTYNNAKALTITTTSVTSSVGSQDGPGGDMQMEGNGTGVGTFYVTKDGIYLGRHQHPGFRHRDHHEPGPGADPAQVAHHRHDQLALARECATQSAGSPSPGERSSSGWWRSGPRRSGTARTGPRRPRS